MRKCDKTTLIFDLLKLLTNERISVAVGDKLSTLVVGDTGSPVDFIKKIGDLKILRKKISSLNCQCPVNNK